MKPDWSGRVNWPLVLALWIALSSNAAILWLLWPRGLAVDYAVFWRAVRQVHAFAASAEPFAYPPTALMWFAPLRLVGFWPGYIAWTAFSVALFGLAALRLYGTRPMLLAIISPAAGVALLPGQTSLFASAGLFAAFATDSPLMRGVLLGAVLTFKPQLVLFAPVILAVDGQRLALAAVLATAGGIALATSMLFGPGIWSDWLGAIPQFQQIVADRGLAMSAVSPGAFASAIAIPALPLVLFGLAAAVFVALRSRHLAPPQAAAMVAVASLFAAPYALRYDLIALAPLMAATVLERNSRKSLIACIAYSAAFGPLCLVAASYIGLARKPHLSAETAA